MTVVEATASIPEGIVYALGQKAVSQALLVTFARLRDRKTRKFLQKIGRELTACG
jgi:hypothetical protein